jgi:hypothetical protein
LFDESMWKDWPPADEIPDGLTPSLPERQPRYVIAKSDSIENLYWNATTKAWATLAGCSVCPRCAVDVMPEPPDGFWMPLERARELEK